MPPVHLVSLHATPGKKKGGTLCASPRIPETREQSLTPHGGMQAAGQEELKEIHSEVILKDPGISTRKP